MKECFPTYEKVKSNGQAAITPWGGVGTKAVNYAFLLQRHFYLSRGKLALISSSVVLKLTKTYVLELTELHIKISAKRRLLTHWLVSPYVILIQVETCLTEAKRSY